MKYVYLFVAYFTGKEYDSSQTLSVKNIIVNLTRHSFSNDQVQGITPSPASRHGDGRRAVCGAEGPQGALVAITAPPPHAPCPRT